MKDNLLREAITEAKQVKAAAIASAKIALEEAFQPHLQTMLARQLRLEAVPNDSSGIGTGNNKDPNLKSSDVPNPGQELTSIGENPAVVNHTIGGDSEKAPNKSDGHESVLHEDDEHAFDVDPDEDENDPMAGANQSGGEFAGMGGEDNFAGPDGGTGAEMGGGDEFGGEEDGFGGGEGGEPSLDIQSIIDELEADILGNAGMGGGDEFGGEEGPMPEEEAVFEDALVGTSSTPNEKLAFGKGANGEDDKIGGDAKKAPNGSDGLPEKLHEEDEEIDETVDLTEILREMNIQDQATNPNHYAKVEEIYVENANLKRSLKEHRNVVRFLRDRINEINMLNAKLLFTNKLFKQYDLNGGQKMRVVENFDRATTLREVKLIFATLAEAYAQKNSSTTKKIRSITEGLASKATGSTKPKNPQLLIEEVDAVRARFKQLAHINS